MFPEWKVILNGVGDYIQNIFANFKVCFQQSYQVLGIIWINPDTILQPVKTHIYQRCAYLAAYSPASFGDIKNKHAPFFIPTPRFFGDQLSLPEHRRISLPFFGQTYSFSFTTILQSHVSKTDKATE